ncbi:MAG: HPr family phosphocarrier protein [Planctomycetaceae bacterium]|jgi:phosphotransferase system HPr (HPr) family protein|nr:HPr family phosphocarrier protein [Planctomycetaceae bacterium]
MINNIKKTLTVNHACGVHARVATILAKKANEFVSDIKLIKGSYAADCRSVLDLLTLGAFKGDRLELVVIGEDAADAAGAITALFDAGFYEE